jgi:NADPH2 dehydrogenase
MTSTHPRVSKLNTADKFSAHLSSLGVDLAFDTELQSGAESVLGSPLSVGNRKIGNRFCILPMEGWDGTSEGKPTELTFRRWRNFGISGAKLIWGGEAVAVRQDGRANPNQLLINAANVGEIDRMRQALIESHEADFGDSSDLLVGLQLTHSGRFARPNKKSQLEPRTAYRHPLLDSKFGVDAQSAILSDDELKVLIDDFIFAAKLAESAGFEWVDIKHCHGYLGHELLSGFDRPGIFGGSFENRTRFLRHVVEGIRAECRGLDIGVRLSIFDFSPYHSGADGIGTPTADRPYEFAWGGDGTGCGIDLSEPRRFVQLLADLGIQLLCTTAGSPYYNPHIQRPAIFPPSDGYQPPEDPLVGVARQIAATAELKAAAPTMTIVGSGYSYLQEWLPHVGQAVVRAGHVDSIGLGRMVLSYPDLPADVLAGRTLARKRICRTFSDCTTAPRNGMVSGCYPLDTFYKHRPEFSQLRELKQKMTKSK